MAIAQKLANWKPLRPLIDRIKWLKYRIKRQVSYGKHPTTIRPRTEQMNHESHFWEEHFYQKFVQEDGPSRPLNDPKHPLSETHQRLVLSSPSKNLQKLRILDVGAGPLTVVGKHWPGHEIEIVAVDPLADEYHRLYRKFCFKPVVETIFGEGENLLKIVPKNSFDLAHSQNALDHSINPVACIQNMVWAVKPGCHVHFWHYDNEAEKQKYQGMHQWNFYEKDGKFFISNRQRQIDVASVLKDVASITCVSGTEQGGFVEVTIQKSL